MACSEPAASARPRSTRGTCWRTGACCLRLLATSAHRGARGERTDTRVRPAPAACIPSHAPRRVAAAGTHSALTMRSGFVTLTAHVLTLMHALPTMPTAPIPDRAASGPFNATLLTSWQRVAPLKTGALAMPRAQPTITPGSSTINLQPVTIPTRTAALQRVVLTSWASACTLTPARRFS